MHQDLDTEFTSISFSGRQIKEHYENNYTNTLDNSIQLSDNDFIEIAKLVSYEFQPDFDIDIVIDEQIRKYIRDNLSGAE